MPKNLPPEKSSDEADKQQLDLARKQGDAFDDAVRTMVMDVAHGRQQRADDFLIGFAVEEAEGMYMPDGGDLRWQEPTDENCHVEVVVRDASDGRFIPGLNVTATLHKDGELVGSHQQPFLWHPWLFHYGRNWKVPGEGDYRLDVKVEPPSFPRHDKRNGKRYAEPVEVTFDNVHIETGRKIS